MKRYKFVAFAVALFLIPEILDAQMQGGGKGQGIMGQQVHGREQGTGMISPGIEANMSKLPEMMNKMSQIMSTGKMTPEQQKQCAEIMEQMSEMMHKISTTQTQKTTEMRQKQLREIEKELDPLFYFIHP